MFNHFNFFWQLVLVPVCYNNLPIELSDSPLVVAYVRNRITSMIFVIGLMRYLNIEY